MKIQHFLRQFFSGFRPARRHCQKPLWLTSYDEKRDTPDKHVLCHAPFKSMLFANNGAVLACCFNRQAVLGFYPQKNLLDIWQSKEADRLRDFIINNDLSHGCFVCREQIHSNQFETVKARMFDHLGKENKGFPLMMEFDIDNCCNLSCEMCNADNSSRIREESSYHGTFKSPYDEGFVTQLDAFIPHLTQASFAGGEPFLIKLYYDIWEKMLRLNSNIRINVVSNGTILNDKIKSLIERGSFDFSISIDSINPKTYSLIRQHGDLKTVLENLAYFKSYSERRQTKLYVWACPLRRNKYEIFDLFDFFGDRNIELYLHTVWVPPSVSLWNLPSSELQELVSYYIEKSLPEDTIVRQKNKVRFNEFVALLEQWVQMASQREKDSLLQKDKAPVEQIVSRMNELCVSKKYDDTRKGDFINGILEKDAFCRKSLTDDVYNKAMQNLVLYPDDFIFQIYAAGTKEMVADFCLYLNR